MFSGNISSKVRNGVKLKIEILIRTSTARPLVNIPVVGGVNALFIGINNIEEWFFFGRGEFEVLRFGFIYRRVLVPAAGSGQVSFQVKDLSVEGGDSPEVSVNLVQLESLLVTIVTGGEFVYSSLGEICGETSSNGFDLDTNIFSVRNILVLRDNDRGRHFSRCRFRLRFIIKFLKGKDFKLLVVTI